MCGMEFLVIRVSSNHSVELDGFKELMHLKWSRDFLVYAMSLTQAMLSLEFNLTLRVNCGMVHVTH